MRRVAVLLVAAMLAASCTSGTTDTTPVTTTTTVITTAPATTATSQATTTTVASEFSPTIWTGPRDPITLAIDPPAVPAEIGVVDVTVTGRSYEETWAMVCSGARGVVNPDEWPGNRPIEVAETCGEVSRDNGTLVNPPVEDGRFWATLRVPIDAQAIGDGGVVITTGDIWVPLGGNVLLRVGSGEEQSPWDRFGSDYYNTSTLENVITDWSAFEAAFNITYRELEGCDEAYSTAEGAQTRYHLNVKWNDETQEKPGAEYDRWVARFMASERWLQMNGCPGAGDFTSVG